MIFVYKNAILLKGLHFFWICDIMVMVQFFRPAVPTCFDLKLQSKDFKKMEEIMKKRSLFALIMVFVLCLSMVMTGCQDDAKTEKPDTETTTAPEEVLTMDLALTNTANALSVSDAGVGALKDLNQKKTVTVAIDQMFTNVLKMDLANSAFYDELSIASEGDGINPDIKVNLYSNGTDIALVSPDLLGSEEAMGCTVESLVTSLMAAAFAGEGSAAALGGLSQYAEVLGDIVNDTELAENMLKDLQKTLEGVTASESKGTVSVDGKDVEAVIFTYTMDKETLLDMVDIYLKYTAENYQKMLDAMVEAGLISAEEAAEEGNIYEEMRNEMDAEMEGINVDTTLDIAVNPDNRCIMRMDISCKLAEDEENIDLAMELVLGENPAESDQIALNITASENDETIMSLKSVLSHTTTGSVDIYSVLLSADVEGEIATMNFTATYNNDNHDYELALTLDEERYAMTGKLENTADKLYFTVDQLEAEGETLPLGLSLTVENTPDCEIPAVPEYTDISSMIDMGALLGSSDYAEEEYYEDYEDYENWEEDYVSPEEEAVLVP